MESKEFGMPEEFLMKLSSEKCNSRAKMKSDIQLLSIPSH